MWWAGGRGGEEGEKEEGSGEQTKTRGIQLSIYPIIFPSIESSARRRRFLAEAIGKFGDLSRDIL